MAEKNDFKTIVLEYLKKNIGKDITRKRLISKTKISKSRLTEILQSIRADGYTIITPPRSGIVRLEADDSLELLPTVKNCDIRRWLIIFLLSRYEKLTFNELLLKLIYMRDDTFNHRNLLIDFSSGKTAYDDQFKNASWLICLFLLTFFATIAKTTFAFNISNPPANQLYLFISSMVILYIH